MSVVIRGMKMPKNCGECEFAQDDSWYGLHCTIQTDEDGWLMDVSSIETDRHPDCPLVELPAQHGRLIDADALMKDGWVLHKQVMRMGGYAIHEMPLTYPTIPTVIEADGESGRRR